MPDHSSSATAVLCLPPLILHPFAEANDTGKLMACSHAGMALEGLLPGESRTRYQLDRALLDGRYCELRMLFYVGKDLTRWIDQCLEVAQRKPQDYPEDISRQSFAAFLVENAPSAVEEKLARWGVQGYQQIFARALALNLMFAEVPEPGSLTEDFIRHYHRYSDQIFGMDQKKRFPVLDPERYTFELFASGEYSRILEREWEAQ